MHFPINSAAPLLLPACDTIWTPAMSPWLPAPWTELPPTPALSSSKEGDFEVVELSFGGGCVERFAAQAGAGGLTPGCSALCSPDLLSPVPSYPCPITSLPWSSLLWSQLQPLCQLRGFSMLGEDLEELLGIISISFDSGALQVKN